MADDVEVKKTILPRKQKLKQRTKQLDDLLRSASPVDHEDFSKSEPPKYLGDIFEQRKKHRERLLRHIIIFTYISLAILVCIIVAQAGVRVFCTLQLDHPCTNDFVLFDNYTFELIVVSVFGQIIGLVYVIVRYLWDDKTYLSHLPGKH